jgi:hypothetical protein
MTEDELIDEMAKAIWLATASNPCGHRDLVAEWNSFEPHDREHNIVAATAALTVARPHIRCEALEEAAMIAKQGHIDRKHGSAIAAAIRAPKEPTK